MKRLIALLLLTSPVWAQVDYNNGVCSADTTAGVAEWICSIATSPPPDPVPTEPDFGGCTAYEGGYVCVVRRDVTGSQWLEYVVQYGTQALYGYWPEGVCPTLTAGVTLTPVCSSTPEPDPVPPPPDPDPIPPPSGDEIARGVPNPGASLGFDPFTFDPAITQTLSNVPATVNAGESIFVTGGNTAQQVTFNCTAVAPCMLKSNGAPRTAPIAVSGSYFVFDGFVFQGDNTESVYARSGANHFVVRNITHTGNNTRRSNGTSMLHGGGDYAVYYNNTIRNIAVADGSDEVDYMAFSVASGSNIWVIGNTSFQVGGDSLKLGQNVARAGGVFPSNIYVAQNNFGNNGENPIDIKWAVNIVLSDNDLHDSVASVSSSGECTVIHESGDNVHFYDNRFLRCNIGIVTATSGGGARYIEVDGNHFSNGQLGIYNRGGGHADITNNRFTGVTRMWENEPNNGSTVTASGNIQD